MEDGTQNLSDRLFNSSGEVAREGPVAFTIRARILRSDSFSIIFMSNKPMCHITSKLNPPGPHPNWNPSLPPFPSRRGTRQSLRFHPGSVGKLYIHKGPAVYTMLSSFFGDNGFETVLIGECPQVVGRKTSGTVYFLIVEQKGPIYSRVGILEIRETFETFSQDLFFVHIMMTGKEVW
jgi:hypothetical protein